MNIQRRLLVFVTRTNWVLLTGASLFCLFIAQAPFTFGVAAGGLIVTVNFHLLYRTLKRSLTPPHIASHHKVIAKYYIRFAVSGFLIFILISRQLVDPLGLFVGLSIVVASIFLATMLEVKKLIFKEAI